MCKFHFAVVTAALMLGSASPASAGWTLLQDTFNTSGSVNDDLALRQAGSLIGATPYQNDNFLTLGTNSIFFNSTLLLNNGVGGSSQATILHDFTDPLILLEEGFTVSFIFDPDTTSASSSSNYFAIALGQRGSTAGTGFPEADSSTDFGVRLAGNGTFFVTRGGSASGVFDASPATNKVYQFDLAVSTTSFAAGNTADISLLIDNTPVDINGAAAGTDLTITWDSEGENYISLISGGSSSLLDNLSVELIPEPSSSGLFVIGMIGVIALRRRLTSR